MGDDDPWAAFGSDEEDDDDADKNNDDPSLLFVLPQTPRIIQALVQHLLQRNTQIALSDRHVGVLLLKASSSSSSSSSSNNNKDASNNVDMWKRALRDRGINVVECHSHDDDEANKTPIDNTTTTTLTVPIYCYDALICVVDDTTTDTTRDDSTTTTTATASSSGTMMMKQLQFVSNQLVPGGCLILPTTLSETFLSHQQESYQWTKLSSSSSSSQQQQQEVYTWLTRRTCRIQQSSCRWLSPDLSQEYARLEQATPIVSVHERTLSQLNAVTIHRAVHALQTTGYCVLGGIINAAHAVQLGQAVLQDLHTASQILKQREGVDLYQPWQSRQEPASYRELSMREDFRMDLRHGPAIDRARIATTCRGCSNNRKMKKDEATTVIDHHSCNNGDNIPSPHKPRILTAQDKSTLEFLRGHANILEIVRTVMNPVQDGFAQGNLGRYNFNGSGADGSFQNLRIGPVGGIVSLPGAADQALHADTPHLFEHLSCLPAHYINVFTPGSVAHETVGQTALLHGTHKLDVTSKYNDPSKDEAKQKQELWKAHLVRPFLQVSDVLLFDCRLLHFGMANESKDVERPLLYTNMWMHWFHDPKNWEHERPIFDDGNPAD